MRPAEGGGGGGTDFRSMSHQQMLAWLDEASSFYVGNAAGRLKEASEEMHRIAEQLKNRTGRVEWEGEAEKAFNVWAESVVSSTHSLGTYGSDAATWMDHAAQAIATAQSATPRYTSHASAKENLAAAIKYRNDPDSATVANNAKKSMAASEDLKAIEAKERANQQEAAAELEKLSGAYTWSSYNMKGLEPPTFPPPPGDFVPEYVGGIDDSGTYVVPPVRRRGGGGKDSTTVTYTSTDDRPGGSHGTTDTNVVPPSQDTTGPTRVVRPEVRPDVPVDLGIDSVDTLPNPTTTGPGPTQTGQPPLTKPDGGTPPLVPTGVPPLGVKGVPGPLGPTAPVTGGSGSRGPLTTNPVTGGARGLGPLGGGPREGISGGRAVPQTTGRPATGIPRGTVIGGEPTGRGGAGAGMGRGPMGAPGMGGPMGGAGAGQSGISGGRRLAGETGGVVGGKAQRAGAVGGTGRPFTPGGSGLVRGSQAKPGEREEQNGERPDYLVEDEETWQQGRRVAPPVID
ncbi:hypothetical protein ACIQCR_14245 [Streptomyces sp. NPDC093249]|uniref:hypothetical protein n=1 Tax=unclassified Streptomyces TaxID=2593676 RepID=UPI0037FECAD1